MDPKIVSLLWLMLCPLFALSNSDCNSIQNCGDCTKTNECVWCRQPDFLGNRCLTRSANTKFCPTEFVVDSQMVISYKENVDLTQSKDSNDPIQLRPQHISLTNVRVGQVYTIPVEFMQAKDYPIDLYFLMDLSNSMDDDKAKLQALGKTLANTMKNKTKFLSMGFGSFVDKRTFPYTWPVQKTYVYRNHMPLDNNTDRFTDEVRQAGIVDTWDLPESGFEALVQVMVCKSTKWREKARRIVLVATDDYPHLAGNGKLGGILSPNDGICHMDIFGSEYLYGLNQDYPSLGQISRLAQDNSINIIFAVTENKIEAYKNFEPLIKGSTADILKKDSSNIVSLVENQYDLITSSVELKDDATDGIRVRYFTTCVNTSANAVSQENATCTGLKVGSLVKYNITIEVTRCPLGKLSHRQSITVSPVGLSDKLMIDLAINCECPCERADNSSCPSRCGQISECIECNPYLSDSSTSEKCPDYCDHLSMAKDDQTSFSSNLYPLRLCVTKLDAYGCQREFFYGYDSRGEHHIRYGNKICSSKISLTNISFMAMGALVAIGLALLLLWRLLLFIYDKREYAKFLNESKNAKWSAGNNPLYVNNTSKFTNPTFNESHLDT